LDATPFIDSNHPAVSDFARKAAGEAKDDITRAVPSDYARRR